MDWQKMQGTIQRFWFLVFYAIIMSPWVLIGMVCRLIFQGLRIGWLTMDSAGAHAAAWASGRKADSRVEILSKETLRKIQENAGRSSGFRKK